LTVSTPLLRRRPDSIEVSPFAAAQSTRSSLGESTDEAAREFETEISTVPGLDLECCSSQESRCGELPSAGTHCG
jgi:hypothetical protein